MRVWRSGLTTIALALSLLALPVASLAHEGHEHPEQSKSAAGSPADDAKAAADHAAERDAKRKKMADEDAAKPKAAPPPPSDAPPGSGPR
jgi:hypothetical protein